MFFSIPYAKETKDDDGSQYTTFQVHVNGALHSCVRYSQLHKLNEQLQKRFDTSKLSEFPPKKLFSLSEMEKEERRLMLELYIQSIGQCVEIAKSNLFVDFLVQSQKEYNKHTDKEPVKFVVFLPDLKEITVEVQGSDYTPEILTAVGNTVGVPEELQPYFGLFLLKNVGQRKELVRRLQDLECPYLTLKSLDHNHSIEMRRGYWSKEFENDLMKNSVTLHMLYIESIRNIEDRWFMPQRDNLKKLKQLKTAGMKEQFIKLSQTEHFYGHAFLCTGTVNYPSEDEQVDVKVYCGRGKLTFVYSDGQSIALPLTRIKCWKLFCEKKDCLSIEFLVMKDTLRWIDIFTTFSSVILISMSLQSMLDEMVLLRNGKGLELTKIRANSGYLPISNKDRKDKEQESSRRPKAPSFSALQNQENELFMEGIHDEDL